MRSVGEKVSHVGDTVVFDCLSHPASRGSTTQLRVDWLKDGHPIATGAQSPPFGSSRRISTGSQLRSRPLPSRRHYLTADSQILVLTGVRKSDCGVYTCVVSNAVGSERAVSTLRVVDGPVTSVENASGDDMATIRLGLVVIAAVCGIVLTSVAWVVVIYCIQRRRDLTDSSSSTSTDETIVPTSAHVDVGTLDSQWHCIQLPPGGHSAMVYSLPA